MFIRYLSWGYWVSLFFFILFQWLAIPVLATLTTSARGVMLGALIIIGVIYPVYFICTIIYLKKVKNLGREELVVAAAFLLIPPLAYLPLIR